MICDEVTPGEWLFDPPPVTPGCGECCAGVLEVRARARSGASRTCCYHQRTESTVEYAVSPQSCAAPDLATCVTVSEFRGGDATIDAKDGGDPPFPFCPPVEDVSPTNDCPPAGGVYCRATSETTSDCDDITRADLIEAAAGAAIWGEWSGWERVASVSRWGLTVEPEMLEAMVYGWTAGGDETFASYAEIEIQVRLIMGPPVKLTWHDGTESLIGGTEPYEQTFAGAEEGLVGAVCIELEGAAA